MILQTFLRWTYALLIRTLPRSFRRENGSELMEHFVWLSDRSPGMTGRLRMWCLLVKDAVSNAVVLRRAEMKKGPMSGTRRNLAWRLSVASAGVLCAFVAVLQFSRESPTGDVLPIAPDSAEPTASPSTEALPTSEPPAPAPVQLAVPTSATSEELFAALVEQAFRKILEGRDSTRVPEGPLPSAEVASDAVASRRNNTGVTIELLVPAEATTGQVVLAIELLDRVGVDRIRGRSTSGD